MSIRVDTQHRTGKKEAENGAHLKNPISSAKSHFVKSKDTVYLKCPQNIYAIVFRSTAVKILLSLLVTNDGDGCG